MDNVFNGDSDRDRRDNENAMGVNDSPGKYGVHAEYDTDDPTQEPPKTSFTPFDYFRFGLYALAVVANLTAIFIEPINDVWVEPFTRAANVLAAVAGGTALTNFTKGKE